MVTVDVMSCYRTTCFEVIFHALQILAHICSSLFDSIFGESSTSWDKAWPLRTIECLLFFQSHHRSTSMIRMVPRTYVNEVIRVNPRRE